MRKVEMTMIFQVEIHDDKVDTDDLCLEFDCDFYKMVVSLASNTSSVVKADVMSYETTAVDILEE